MKNTLEAQKVTAVKIAKITYLNLIDYQITIIMNFLVELNLCSKFSNKYFSILDKQKKPRVLVFTDKDNAIKYAEFAVATKCRFNQWPTLDASNLKHNPFQDAKLKCHVPDYVCRYVHVVEIEDDIMNREFARNGVSVYLSDSFTWNDDFSIEMTIGARDYNYLNIEIFKEILEQRLHQ